MAGTRKIAAILVADIVGYSRLAGVDEDRTLARLRGLRSGRGSVTSRIHRSFMRSVPLNEERRLSDHELE
jgi:adenylate cyclase